MQVSLDDTSAVIGSDGKTYPAKGREKGGETVNTRGRRKGTRDSTVARLPLDLPPHLKRRAIAVITRLSGLESISTACRVSVDTLVWWHLEWGFPLRRKGKQWTTTTSAIEGWLRNLPKQSPRQECRG